MPLKRRQNLSETDRGSYYKEEWLEEFLDSKGEFYNGNDDETARGHILRYSFYTHIWRNNTI